MFVYPGSLLNMQNTYANKYDGFEWTISNGGAWTPAEGFLRPTAEAWESCSRENGNSIIERQNLQ